MTTQVSTVRKRRFRWRVVWIILVLLLLIGGAAGIFIARRLLVQSETPPSTLTTQVVPVEQRDLAERVQVNGALEPRDRAKVSFPEGVRVREVLVKEGERVAEDQVLARLETRDLELKVASSKAQLDQVQQALDKLQAGPTEAERAQAGARVARARAAIAALQQEVRPLDVETSRQQLEAARQRLAELQEGIPPDTLREAEKSLFSAQDALNESRVNLEKTRDTASRAKTQAEQAMERGVDDLKKAQRAYSDAFWDWDYVQRTGADPRQTIVDTEGRESPKPLKDFEIEEYRRKFEDAGVSLKDAELAVKNLTETFDQAREDEIRQIQEAERAITKSERDLAEAQRSFDKQRTQGLSEALLKARKELADAEKAYSDLADNPERPARRAEAEANLQEALAAQKKLAAGADPIELAKARTDVETARAALAKAEADLDAATLRAPIAGTVVGLTLKAGTLTTTSDAVDIADLRTFLIRARVTEENVAKVRVGMAVMVTIDSVPGQVFSGTLMRVSELPAEQNQSGGGSFPGGPGVNPSGGLGGLYPVEIVIEATDERLRVGMATTANIEIFAIPNALVIPLQAVETGPNGPFVRKATGGNGPDGTPLSEEVAVELGKSSGDSVQVLRGLAPGDSVVLQQLPPPEMPQFGPRG